MVMQKRHFLYQPNALNSVICWSWTLMIFLIGVIIWLEITYFQWITLFFFTLFFIVAWIQIRFRHLTIENDQLVVSKVTNPHWLSINLSQISSVTTTKYQLGIIANNKIYQFLLPANSVIEIAGIIQKSIETRV